MYAFMWFMICIPAMLLGAAKLLMQNKEQIEGTVKLVFQPDEEGFTGLKRYKQVFLKTLKLMQLWQCMCIQVHHKCYFMWIRD